MKSIALVAGLVLLCTWPSAAAHADEAPPGQTYRCTATGQSVPEATTASVVLDSVPAYLRPGDTLSLQGTLSLRLPQDLTDRSRLQLASKIGIQASDFGVDVKVAGHVTRLQASSVVGDLTAIQSPTTVSASLTFPDLAIPASAAGDVSVLMPTEARTNADPTSAAGPVVFSTTLDQDSLLVKTRQLDCSADPSSTPTVLASIRLAAPSAGDGPAPSASAKPPAAGAAAAAAAPASVGAAAELPSAVPAPSEAPPAEAQPEVAAQNSVSPAAVRIPPRTASRGTFVPYWSLVLSFALAPGACLAYAVRQGRRLRRVTVSGASEPQEVSS